MEFCFCLRIASAQEYKMVKQERRHKYRDLELEERRYSIAVVYPDMVSGVSILEYLKLMVKRLTKMQHNLTYVVDCSPNSDLCQINRYRNHLPSRFSLNPGDYLERRSTWKLILFCAAAALCILLLITVSLRFKTTRLSMFQESRCYCN